MRAQPQRPASPSCRLSGSGAASTKRLSREQTPGLCSRSTTGRPMPMAPCMWATPLNKILKDIINKYALLRGPAAGSWPGWTATALPDRAEGAAKAWAVRSAALSNQPRNPARARRPTPMPRAGGGQKAGFQRWGIWADWYERLPHLQRGYEGGPRSRSFRADGAGGPHLPGPQARALEPSSRTALAEAELRTSPDGHTSPSVYVAFPVTAGSRGHGQRLLAAVGISRSQRSLWLAPWGPPPCGGDSGPPPPLDLAGPTLAVSVTARSTTPSAAPSPDDARQMEPRRNCQHLNRGGGAGGEPANQPGLPRNPC